jgi:hypothetical protein
MDSAQLPSPQIGRILIAAGLLSEAQLAQALEEQRETGRRLGEIIVRRGFISGPALANALAEQHGGLLKTEYGFATGLGGDVAQKAATEAAAEAASSSSMPLLRTADPAPVTPIRPAEPEAEPVAVEPEPEPEPAPTIAAVPEPEPELETPQPQFAFASPEPEPEPEPVAETPPAPQFAFPPAPEPEPAAPQEPTPQFARAPEPQPVFEPEPVAAAAPEPVLPEPEPDPAPVAVEPEVAVAVRDERDDLIESLRARIDAQDAELAELRAELEQLRAAGQVQVLVHPPDEPAPPAPAAPPGQQERYLVCVPTAAGYVLLDRIGVVPLVGQSVDVPEEEGSFTVTKVVRLPRNGRPCAYLQRV